MGSGLFAETKVEGALMSAEVSERWPRRAMTVGERIGWPLGHEACPISFGFYVFRLFCFYFFLLFHPGGRARVQRHRPMEVGVEDGQPIVFEVA